MNYFIVVKINGSTELSFVLDWLHTILLLRELEATNNMEQRGFHVDHTLIRFKGSYSVTITAERN